jgi:alkylated DNA repair dioxygenase AlkB
MIEIAPGIGFAPPLDDADAVLAQLEREIEVSDELVKSHVGIVPTPRRTAWYGDSGALYTYSGITRTPRAWTPALAALRDRLNAQLDIALNSCLVGVYENGADNVDWHADDEPELRDRIVSVSLGATRTFHVRDGRTVEHRIPLEHGSGLVMSVASQTRWQHALPPQPHSGRRVNLTYRVIAHD